MSSRVPTGWGSAAWPAVAVAAGLVVALQLWGLYAPQLPARAEWFRGADKVQHAIAFGLPVVLVTWADTRRRRDTGRPPRARVLVIVVWVSAAHAVVSELVQHAAYANRVGDPRDVLADWSGIAVGGLIAGTGLTLRQRGRRRVAVSTDGRPDRG